MSDECVCVFPDEGYPDGFPDEGLPEQCIERGPRGTVCTREPGHDGQHVACNVYPEHRLEEWEADSLIEALQDSDCHPDLVAYARKARGRGGTPILSSLERFHENSGVEKIARVGTAIEKTLWQDGARATLDRHGNVDQTNEAILREIVPDYLGDR